MHKHAASDLRRPHVSPAIDGGGGGGGVGCAVPTSGGSDGFNGKVSLP